jgi:hypothetical protein
MPLVAFARTATYSPAPAPAAAAIASAMMRRGASEGACISRGLEYTAVTRAQIDYARRHLRLGWWSLFVFATFGMLLEAFHAFKVRAYLDVSNDTRRLMWTLAHAHGTALAIVNVAFGFTLRAVPDRATRLAQYSSLLVAATLLMPAAFFVGGFGALGGDPGLGVFLLPAAAVLLLAALLSIARSL